MLTQQKDLARPSDLESHGEGTGALRSKIPQYVDLLPPCNNACPAGENIQAWLSLAQEGRYAAAWQTLVEENPLPAVHGRVCYHPCEDHCNRAQIDTTVSIHAIERFLGDKALEENWQIEVAPASTGKKVLVVGGSSATATCTVNAQGGIDVVTMTASGSAYTSEPTLTITPKVSGSTAADLLIHLGTETSKCTVWDGAIPGGYDPSTSSTWPIFPSAAPNYYSIAVPATDGTTLVANVRTFCDGSTC